MLPTAMVGQIHSFGECGWLQYAWGEVAIAYFSLIFSFTYVISLFSEQNAQAVASTIISIDDGGRDGM